MMKILKNNNVTGFIMTNKIWQRKNNNKNIHTQREKIHIWITLSSFAYSIKNIYAVVMFCYAQQTSGTENLHAYLITKKHHWLITWWQRSATVWCRPKTQLFNKTETDPEKPTHHCKWWNEYLWICTRYCYNVSKRPAIILLTFLLLSFKMKLKLCYHNHYYRVGPKNVNTF